MTKQEAIEQMKLGNKVRHRYFSDDEWVTMDGIWFLFEDGVRCGQAMFWNDRSGTEWEIDWELVK